MHACSLRDCLHSSVYTCISESLFVIITANRSLENVVDVHVRKVGVIYSLWTRQQSLPLVRKLIGKFIIDNEEKFQYIIDKRHLLIDKLKTIPIVDPTQSVILT